ncbi:hypothetical protein N9F93_00010 [bacterium]|nr:hypothetical protein [bacterium]
MPTNYTLPNQGAYTFSDYIGISAQDNGNSIFPSVLQGGGYQEMPTIQDRNEIGIGKQNQDSGFGDYKISGDGWGTGRRRVGMLVYVMSEQKLYQLIPNGYFGNNGSLGVTEWMALTDAQKFELLAPEESYNAGFSPIPPPTGTYTEGVGSGDGNECWVELVLGGDNIYTSNLADGITMTEDVGGMPTGTAVSDLTDVKTYDQLFDTILFPTSYPTASQPSTSLSDNVSNLQTIGATIDMILNTTANLGNISLNGVSQGQYAGNVIAASINGESGNYTLGVGPQGNAIDNQPVDNFEVQIGTNSWTLTTTFDNGPMPLDSTGADYPSLQYSSGNKTNSTSFEGVYPIKLGLQSSNNDFENRALISHGASLTQLTCSQDYPESGVGVRHRIGISDDMIAGRTVGFQQYNPVSSSYADLDASEFDDAPQTFTIEGSPVGYTVYTKASPAGGGDVNGLPLYRIKFS